MPRRPARPDEVPEADAFEPQDEPDVDEPTVRELPREAAEADVLDQALPAGDADDAWRDQ